MKAGVFVREGVIEMANLPDPQARAGEVVLRVRGCGVCGTDVHILHGDLKEGVVPPVVLGHEIVGEIIAVGDGVSQWSAGQTVAVDPVVSCGRCEFCQIGRPNLCPASTVIGYSRHGGYAEYVAVPASHVVAISPKVGLKGGILVETLACVLNGYERLGFEAGRTAMILGAGAVGLLWNQMLKHSPSACLIQTEPVAYRRQIASELGADLVIDPSCESVTERVREALPEGVDFIVDASGDPQAVEEGIRLVRKGGTFMIFGVCPKGREIHLDPHEAYQREMRIIASKMPPRKLNQAARLLESGNIDYERIVTTVRGLDGLVEAIRLFSEGRDRHVKIAIDPTA
jgi:2-desacetyl-2-hydroxyethyl bacteriochlorophyllide A dehydrogenase